MSTDDPLQASGTTEPVDPAPTTEDTPSAPDEDMLSTPVEATKPAETTETTEPTKPEETAEPENITPTESPADTPAASRGITEFMDSHFGTSYKNKYPTDVDFLASIPHLERRLSQRDEAAVLGQEFGPYASRIRELLAADKQQPEQPQQPGQQPAPQQPATLPSYDQVQSWRQEIELAQANGQTPHPETMRQYKAAADAVARRTYELASTPQQTQVTSEQTQQQVSQEVQQQLAAGRQQDEYVKQQQSYAGDFKQRNAHWMFNGGDQQKGMTPQGQQFANVAQQQAEKGAPWDVAINHALATVVPGLTQQQPQATLPITPQAMRQPEVATSPVEQVSDKDMQAKFLKQYGFAEGLSRFHDYKQSQQ